MKLSQTEKHKYMISIVCENLKYDANEHFYKIETDSQT